MPFFPNPNPIPIKIPNSNPIPVVTGLKHGLACDMDQKKCETGSSYRKSDIEKLAEKCGVPTEGTRKQLCNRLKEKFDLKDTE